VVRPLNAAEGPMNAQCDLISPSMLNRLVAMQCEADSHSAVSAGTAFEAEESRYEMRDAVPNERPEHREISWRSVMRIPVRRMDC
jgi:hypothetical protein